MTPLPRQAQQARSLIAVPEASTDRPIATISCDGPLQRGLRPGPVVRRRDLDPFARPPQRRENASVVRRPRSA